MAGLRSRLADQVTASLLAEATIPGTRPSLEKKGAPIGPIPHDAPRRSGG
jgi:hypothetical protein